MTEAEEQNGADARVNALKPWVAPQIISSDARDTASNALPTFIESTVPTDRPS
jgi:hypothetical protein